MPSAVADQLAALVVDRDIDIAVSHRMRVDNCAVQPLEILFGGIDTVATIPVFVKAWPDHTGVGRRPGRLGA